jgi:hypothetical protein
MLFDMQDYVRAGIIGPNQTPMTTADWEDMRSTAAETRDAFEFRVGQYIDASNIATSPCDDKLTELLQLRLDSYDAYVEQFDIFWPALIDDSATAEQYKAYTDSLETYVKSVRSLVAIIDGDRFKIIN